MTFLPAVALNLGRSAIESIAEAYSRIAKYSPSQRPQEMVDPYGGRVKYKDFLLAPDEAESIEVSGVRDFDIFLSRHSGSIDERFTVAHELGHYVLHFLYRRASGEDVPTMSALRYGPADDPAEAEANWFALAYLMPSDQVRQDVSRSLNVLEVASKYMVQPQLAALRLRQIDNVDSHIGSNTVEVAGHVGVERQEEIAGTS